jgi:hypothetical protein
MTHFWKIIKIRPRERRGEREGEREGEGGRERDGEMKIINSFISFSLKSEGY